MPNKTIVAIGALAAILITAIIKGLDGYLVYSLGGMITLLGGVPLYKLFKP